jgi:putative nucleotidyltransferase with HDIG domain
MYLALYLLCGFYIFQHERRLLSDLRQFITLLGFVVLTVATAWIAASDQWRCELFPLLIFAMTCAIAYRYEIALLLGAAVSLATSLSLGLGLTEFVILTASVSVTVILTGDIRSRTRLLYVGLGGAAVAFFTTLGVGVLAGQPFVPTLVNDAIWFGFCAVLSGLLMTGLLPFIERVFDVQTDLSLLELGDISHPLLQELIRRAPGTYNHSINVASIGEAAADAIGANGLLVRVGAYFHDIGKMLKPGYFVENQGEGGNRHDSLLPAMSTLVIIAHVKDGADLARQHHLPQRIIDFIEQHHGTTLVEYFYRQAAKQCEEDPHGGHIDETSFRYPGPKPQSKEAGVMMLADAVESASRALVDPTPARIESLVKEIAMKRLLDGQFNECGLTLEELHVVQGSLIKSLTAVYHGRVKYPDQQTA